MIGRTRCPGCQRPSPRTVLDVAAAIWLVRHLAKNPNHVSGVPLWPS